MRFAAAQWWESGQQPASGSAPWCYEKRPFGSHLPTTALMPMMLRHSRTYLSAAATAVCVALAGCVGPGPGTSHSQAARSVEASVPDWLLGVWHRQWLEEDGVRSNSREVYYLQTPTVFGDVRFPVDRPAFSRAASFADLSAGELRWLAQQQGFTGRTRMTGAVATWSHEISFQPSDGTTDAGRLERKSDGIMYEHGLDGSYTEAWKTVPGRAGRYLVIRIERSGRLDRVLIVAGDHFLYVRNREKDLPVASSLDSLMSSTNATRDQVIEYLDCEFSTGWVTDGHSPWVIQRSTLPWREAHRLDLVDQVLPADIANGLTRHNTATERWTIPVNTLKPSDIKALFGAAPSADG